MTVKHATMTLRDFNPRSHTGSDPWLQVEHGSLGIFQSTLPYWERQGWKENDLIKELISIHAPILGATASKNASIDRAMMISIHAPILGATLGMYLY